MVGGGWGGAHARAQGPRARAYAPGSRAQGPGPLGLWAQGPEPRAQAPDPSLWPRAWSGQFLARSILDAVFKKTIPSSPKKNNSNGPLDNYWRNNLIGELPYDSECTHNPNCSHLGSRSRLKLVRRRKVVSSHRPSTLLSRRLDIIWPAQSAYLTGCDRIESTIVQELVSEDCAQTMAEAAARKVPKPPPPPLRCTTKLPSTSSLTNRLPNGRLQHLTSTLRPSLLIP